MSLCRDCRGKADMTVPKSWGEYPFEDERFRCASILKIGSSICSPCFFRIEKSGMTQQITSTNESISSLHGGMTQQITSTDESISSLHRKNKELEDRINNIEGIIRRLPAW